jgi:CO dehydrogenase/acetyl-CoA synthase alpha subunit
MMVTKIKELTVVQLKTLVDELVEEKLGEILGDSDKGLQVKPEVLKELRASLAATRRGKRGIPLERLAKELGLDLE